MHLTFFAANLTCLALVIVDLIARTWRIQWYVRGLGHRISFAEAFTVNVFGDAASALTPLRIGGEPARLGGMLRADVPAAASFVVLSIETLAAWPVLGLFAIAIGSLYAPEWWRSAGPSLARASGQAWPWVVAIGLVSVLAWWGARRWTHPGVRALRRPIQRVRVYWRRMPAWPIIASVPLSLVNIAARTALLPVLAFSQPEPIPIGFLLAGSFALLYSQLVLPTPAGLGAVDLGFLAGAAGELGSERAVLLLVWRFYSVGAGAILGVWLALRIYGWRMLRELVRRA